MNNKYLKKSLIRFAIIYVFLMSFAWTFMKIDYNNWNEFLNKQEFKDVDTQSFEYIIDEYNLENVYKKIKNKEFDKIDDVDKTIIKQFVNNYDEYEQTGWGEPYWIDIGGQTSVKIKKWLSFDKKTLENNLKYMEPEVIYFTSFYKVVIDGDKDFAKYINKDLDKNIINNINSNKESNNAVAEFIKSDKFKANKAFQVEAHHPNSKLNRKEEYQDIFKRAYENRITGVIFLSVFIIVFGIVMFVFLAAVIGSVLDELSEKNNTL